MKKMQEYVHRFRTGSSSSSSGTKAFAGGAMSVSLPSSPAPTSRTSTEGTRTGDGSHKGTSSETTSVWYVENPTDMAVKPPELSSLPMMTSSGLQHTVLSALVKSDLTPLPSSPSAYLQSGQSKQESRNKTQPEGTFVYCVTASDTLERVAARYDVTPSELQKLNRLASRMVFAGQLLYIPDPSYVSSGPPTPESVSPPCSPVDSRPKLDVPIIRMADKSPEHVPGHVMKVSSPVSMKAPSLFTPPRILSEEEAKQLDEECFERFIKLTAKYISDGMGVVQGTLLVTPNAIMFDPNANDPLVMENGPEQYGVIVVMETIQSAALYHDPAAMTYRKLSNLERASSPKPVVYHGEARSRAYSSSEIQTSDSKALNNSSSTPVSFQEITTKNSISGLSHFFEGSEIVSQDTEGPHCVSGLSPFFPGPSDSCTDDISSEGHDTTSSSSNVLDKKKLTLSGEELVDTLSDKTDKEDHEKGSAFIQCTSWKQKRETDTSVLGNFTSVPDDYFVLSEHQPGAVDAFHDIATQSSEALAPFSDAVIRQVGFDTEKYSLIVKERRLSAEDISATPETVIPASHQSFDLNETDINAAPPFVPLDLATFLQGEDTVQKNASFDGRQSSLPRSEECSVDDVFRSSFAGLEVQACNTKMSLKPADDQMGFQDFPQNMGTVIEKPMSAVFDNVEIKTEGYTTLFSTQNGGDSKSVSQREELVDVADSECLCQNKDAQRSTDGSVGEDGNVSGVHRTKDEQGTGNARMPMRTDSAEKLSYEQDTTEGQEVREERIGNIVYFPIEENQDGKVIVHENYITPLPISPSHTSQMASDSEVNITTRDAVDGSVTSYNESKPRSSSGSFSSLRSSAQQISSLVNYATGLFRSSNEDKTSVKDVADSSPNPREKIVLTESEDLNRGLNNVVPDRTRPEHSIDVENAVKADERPDLFQPIEQLIPRPAASGTQPPLYLHLHVGQNQQHRNITSSVPWETYRQSSPKPDYWFSIPRAKADNVYAFFVQWRPEIYGDSDEFDPEEQGFVVVQKPEVLESVDENLQVVEEHFGGSKTSFKKDWEIVSWKEALRRQSVDTEPSIMPELNDESSILNAKQIYELSESLPPRTIGYKWSLVYSTAKHGFSLNRLYREMAHLDSPVLLVVMDTAGYIFGAFISTPLKVTDHFYGTGECCLWAFRNELKMYRWTGQNTFFIKGNFDSISIGASEGKFGLWLDGDLYHGRSHRCSTFDNEVLSSREDFLLKGLEAWSFGD